MLNALKCFYTFLTKAKGNGFHHRQIMFIICSSPINGRNNSWYRSSCQPFVTNSYHSGTSCCFTERCDWWRMPTDLWHVGHSNLGYVISFIIKSSFYKILLSRLYHRYLSEGSIVNKAIFLFTLHRTLHQMCDVCLPHTSHHHASELFVWKGECHMNGVILCNLTSIGRLARVSSVRQCRLVRDLVHGSAGTGAFYLSFVETVYFSPQGYVKTWTIKNSKLCLEFGVPAIYKTAFRIY